ncbi:MAG: LysM peptidoglycan-binding domain-containing protein [Chitinophagaceae bacterium]|nr:LysM peptidoglycan-binding domain-containing protein [Chitinophagaceae bacterium]
MAEQHNIPLARLFDFNDMKPQETAAADQLIYLQRKRRTGANEFHTVAPGETLREIAQKEAIRLESLQAYNFLKEGMQPAEGEILNLRGQASARPQLEDVKFKAVVTSLKKEFSEVKKEVSELLKRDKTANDFVVHTVQPKETLYSITKKYDVSVDEVIKWNELQNQELKVGQQLRINKKSANALH